MSQPLPFPIERLLKEDGQLIQIVDAALADATRRAGGHLACRPGCTQCCHGAFSINPLDALRLRTAMTELQSANPPLAARIAGRARSYLAEFGPKFPGDQETGILGTAPEDEAAFEDFANEAPCPALNPESGLCDLYDARPMTCRVFGPPVRQLGESEEENGLAVCELCFTQASEAEIEAAEMTVPHAEEQSLLDQLHQIGPGAGDTIVAHCLTLQAPVRPGPTGA
jgi:Fe-S-cluster containining protein